MLRCKREIVRFSFDGRDWKILRFSGSEKHKNLWFWLQTGERVDQLQVIRHKFILVQLPIEACNAAVGDACTANEISRHADNVGARRTAVPKADTPLSNGVLFNSNVC